MTSTSSPDDEWDFPNAATPLGTPAYYAVRFSPRALQRRYALLFAWRDLIVTTGAQANDPGVARLKLHWWREEVAGIANGQARHPLTLALQSARLPPATRSPMLDLLDAVENELLADGLADDGAFARACRDEGGSFFLLLQAATPDTSQDPGPCQAAGAYCNAVERLRLAAAQPGRVPRDLAGLIGDNAGTEKLRERCTALIGDPAGGVADRDEGMAAICRRLLALGQALHGKLARTGYPVADTLVDRPPIAHLWTAWRCR